MLNVPILSIICYLPLLGALFIIFGLKSSQGSAIRKFATAVAFVDFLISLPLWFLFNRDGDLFQFRESAPWIESIGVRYEFGIDGIALLLVLLTTLLGVLAFLSSWSAIARAGEGVLHLPAPPPDGHAGRLHGHGLLPLLRLLGSHAGADVLPDRHLGRPAEALRGHQVLPLHAGGLGADAARHPGALLLQLQWPLPLEGAGQRGDVLASPQFHDIGASIPPDLQFWIFLAFFVGFAIKVPMFPFHTWLPDAHVEAPTAGSVILAGVLLKMGTYGFVRFSLPILPDATMKLLPWMAALSLIGIIYGALVAMAQKDMKKLVAYSSVSHLGFVMLGMFALNGPGLNGSVLQMINHGHLDRRALPSGRRHLRAAAHAPDLRVRRHLPGDAASTPRSS